MLWLFVLFTGTHILPELYADGGGGWDLNSVLGFTANSSIIFSIFKIYATFYMPLGVSMISLFLRVNAFHNLEKINHVTGNSNLVAKFPVLILDMYKKKLFR